MKNRMKSMVAAAALAAVMTPGVASAVVIDTFDVVEVGALQIVSLPGAGAIADLDDNLDTSMVVGGSRHLALTSAGILGSESLVATAGGILSYSNDSLTSSTLKVTWDGSTDGVASPGLGGVDITDMGEDTGFSLFITSDLDGVDVKFDISDTGAGASTITKSASSGGGLLFFDYIDFVGVADLTDIDVIMMTISGPERVDITVDLLETGNPVPEPVSAGLGVIGLAALGTKLRRRTA